MILPARIIWEATRRPAAGVGVLVLLSPPVQAASFLSPATTDLMLLASAVGITILCVFIVVSRRRRTLAALKRTKKTLEQNYQLLDAVFNHSPIGMMVQNENKRIVRSNPALASILGLQPEVLDNMGMALRNLITDERVRETLIEAYEHLQHHPSHMLKVKLPIRAISGRNKWVLVSAQTLVSEGTITGILWQVQDITREENALRELQRISSLDPLTGLLNRRAFMQSWRSERARALRQNTPLSLVIMDLDHFKQVNDRYGHQAGDDVLIHVAQVLQAHTRDSDIIARFGGEEFVMLLPDTDLRGAEEAAEKVRIALSDSPVRIAGTHTLHVSFSAGVAQWVPEEPFETLYKQADSALYQAKSAGRNCTRVWDSNAQLKEV